MDSFAPTETFTLLKTLETPSHVSSLAFGHAGHLFAGSGEFLNHLAYEVKI